MIKCFQKILKDETGTVITSEMLVLIMGVVVISGIILKTVSNPLRVLHEGTVRNITRVSRGF